MNTDTLDTRSAAPVEAAELVREYGPFAGSDCVNGVSFDGQHVWAATGAALVAFDPDSGDAVRTLALPCDAGTAFDGTHLYQIADARIDRIDPRSGEVLASIPAPGGGTNSGMAWAEGSLWVGQYRQRRIHQVDPASSAVQHRLQMPDGRGVSGLESDGAGLFYCGAGHGRVCAVKRPVPAQT